MNFSKLHIYIAQIIIKSQYYEFTIDIYYKTIIVKEGIMSCLLGNKRASSIHGSAVGEMFGSIPSLGGIRSGGVAACCLEGSVRAASRTVVRTMGPRAPTGGPSCQS